MKDITDNNITDRELLITKLLDAPVELVWEAWSNPEHICNWWGPDGFTCTISKMELRPEGEWHLVLHGPDGIDYKNRSIFKEIIPQQKISYWHESAPHFMGTITFEDRGEQTFLTWRMLFDTKEEFIQTVKVFKADQGLKQNVVKLQEYLNSMKS
ncbi:SRPBCC family protein [Mucilaginibacter ximonensis]|uniref:SRPBCC family protein n=1 Tax=Mucilaginibacter ximonensis TaxID=538021 RepID=A0ABW5YAV4_9SPHI